MDRMQEPGSAVSDRLAASEPPVRSVSFEAFFEGEHERLCRAMYLVTGNAQEAEELMQGRVLGRVGAVGAGERHG